MFTVRVPLLDMWKPSSTIRPCCRTRSPHRSIADCTPAASITTSNSPNSLRISADFLAWGSTAASAPIRRAIASRQGIGSNAQTKAAPCSRATISATSPMNPQPTIATRSPTRVPNRCPAWITHATGSPSAQRGSTLSGSFTSRSAGRTKYSLNLPPSAVTASPALRSATFAPTFSTMPLASWPSRNSGGFMSALIR